MGDYLGSYYNIPQECQLILRNMQWLHNLLYASLCNRRQAIRTSAAKKRILSSVLGAL